MKSISAQEMLHHANSNTMRPPTILEGSQSPTRAKADGALAVKGKIDGFEEFEKFPVPPTDSQRASVRSVTTV